VCFFFSSRRRHTRFSRDWSSDVCSSDLRRQRRRLGEAEWRRLAARSSNLPFLALFRSPRLPSLRRADLWRLAAALLLYALLYLAHGPVIGVPPAPLG